MIKFASTLFANKKEIPKLVIIASLILMLSTDCESQSQKTTEPSETSSNLIIYASQTINSETNNASSVNIYVVNPDVVDSDVVDSDDLNQRKPVPLPNGASEPSWSPDKSNIVFVQTEEDGRFIYSSTINGTQINKLTNL